MEDETEEIYLRLKFRKNFLLEGPVYFGNFWSSAQERRGCNGLEDRVKDRPYKEKGSIDFVLNRVNLLVYNYFILLVL